MYPLFISQKQTKNWVILPAQLVTHQTRCSLAFQFGDGLLNLVEHGACLLLWCHHLFCTLALLCQVNINGVKLGEFFFVHFLPVLVPFWQKRWWWRWKRDARWRNSFIYFLSLMKKKRFGSRRGWCTKKVQELGFLLFMLFVFLQSYSVYFKFFNGLTEGLSNYCLFFFFYTLPQWKKTIYIKNTHTS